MAWLAQQHNISVWVFHINFLLAEPNKKNSKVRIIEDYFLTQNRIEGSKVYINTDLINSRYFYNEYFKVTNTLTNTSLTYYRDSSDQHQYLAEESALVSNQGVLSSTGGKVSFNITTEI